MAFEDYTTVEEALGGNVILVGEQHEPPGAEYCEELAARVLDEYEPKAVAIERSRARPRQTSAMGVVSDYAESESVPLLGIDGRRRWHQCDTDTTDILVHANMFTRPIQENGDLNPKAIENARRIIWEIYGPEVSRAMHGAREKIMAQYLRQAVDEYGGPIVAAIGAFHVPAVVEQLENDTSQIEFESRRVRTNATA